MVCTTALASQIASEREKALVTCHTVICTGRQQLTAAAKHIRVQGFAQLFVWAWNFALPSTAFGYDNLLLLSLEAVDLDKSP